MIIKYTSDNIIIWHYGEKYLTSNDIVKYYTSIYDNCFIEFDDDSGDVVFDNVTIELDKNQYKDLNKVINNQINNKRETLIDNVYDRLLNKLGKPNSEHDNLVKKLEKSKETVDEINSRGKYIERPKGKYINNSKGADFFYVYKRH